MSYFLNFFLKSSFFQRISHFSKHDFFERHAFLKRSQLFFKKSIFEKLIKKRVIVWWKKHFLKTDFVKEYIVWKIITQKNYKTILFQKVFSSKIYFFPQILFVQIFEKKEKKHLYSPSGWAHVSSEMTVNIGFCLLSSFTATLTGFDNIFKLFGLTNNIKFKLW